MGCSSCVRPWPQATHGEEIIRYEGRALHLPIGNILSRLQRSGHGDSRRDDAPGLRRWQPEREQHENGEAQHQDGDPLRQEERMRIGADVEAPEHLGRGEEKLVEEPLVQQPRRQAQPLDLSENL